jgi:glycine cleavage system H protein
VRVAGGIATVGITDHAQHELTDIVFVELPAVGRKVKTGEACAVVESVKTASDIYSPVGGEIIEANKAVVTDPALANTEPYAGGWFYKIKLANPSELEALLSPEQYSAQIGA